MEISALDKAKQKSLQDIKGRALRWEDISESHYIKCKNQERLRK
jgi:hypothetical protein